MNLNSCGWILIILLTASIASGQTESELKSFGKALGKAGKLTHQKSLKESLKYCVRIIDSARNKLKDNSKADITSELKSLQLKLREIQPLSISQSRAFQDILRQRLNQVVGFLIRKSVYRAELRKPPGIQRLVVETPEGSVWVNAPDDLKFGEKGSGSISADPAAAYAYAAQIEGRDFALNPKPAPWTILPTATSVSIRLKTRDGMDVVTTQFVIRSGPANTVGALPSDLTEEAPPAEPKIDLQIPQLNYRLPSLGWIGGPVPVQGEFDGDSSNTTIRFDDVQSLILAESPRQTVVQPPSGQYGLMEISIQEGRVKVSCWFRSLWLRVTTPKTVLKQGESAAMTLQVYGLRHYNKPIMVQLDNLTTDAAALEGGAHQSVVIPANGLLPDGHFEMKRNLTGIQPVRVRISAALNLTPFMDTCDLAD